MPGIIVNISKGAGAVCRKAAQVGSQERIHQQRQSGKMGVGGNSHRKHGGHSSINNQEERNLKNLLIQLDLSSMKMLMFTDDKPRFFRDCRVGTMYFIVSAGLA